MDLIKTIVENQLTAEKTVTILEILTEHEDLIRQISLQVMQGKYGGGKERENALGIFYDEVQKKITWAYQTAEDVWAGKYGNGDEHRRELIGPDYDLVKYRVNETRWEHGVLTIDESMITIHTEDIRGGKRYVMPAMPTALGTRAYYGYPQTRQGDNPYNFSGSGCGIASAYTCVATIKGYNMNLKEWADKNLEATGGTKCPISTAVMQKLFDIEKIKYKRVKTFTTASLADTLKKHLQTGNPAVIALTRKNRAGVNHKGRYANSEHYATLTHMNTDGKRAFLYDSSGDPNRGPRWVDLYDICDHVPTAREREDFSPVWNGWANCGGALLVYMK